MTQTLTARSQGLTGFMLTVSGGDSERSPFPPFLWAGRRLPGRGYGTGSSPRRRDTMRVSEAGNDCLVNRVLIDVLSSFHPHGEAGETATDQC